MVRLASLTSPFRPVGHRPNIVSFLSSSELTSGHVFGSKGSSLRSRLLVACPELRKRSDFDSFFGSRTQKDGSAQRLDSPARSTYVSSFKHRLEDVPEPHTWSSGSASSQ